MRGVWLSTLVALVTLLLVGCAPQPTDTGQGTGTGGETATGTGTEPQVAGTQETWAAPSMGTAELTANITERSITLTPSSIPAGDAVLYVTNNGDVVHSLQVQGPNNVDTSTVRLAPGQTARVALSGLTAGTYRVFDPVARPTTGTTARQATLTVTQPGSATGGTGTTPRTTTPPTGGGTGTGTGTTGQ